MFYTLKEEVLIDRNEKKVRVEYIKNEELKRGKYKVHLYTKNYKIGSGEFFIK